MYLKLCSVRINKIRPGEFVIKLEIFKKIANENILIDLSTLRHTHFFDIFEIFLLLKKYNHIIVVKYGKK